LNATDAAEIARLERRHRDIATHGAGVIPLVEAKTALQQRRQDFVQKHGLKCFKCGSGFNDWARCGKTNGRAWAICVPCIRSKRT
jgi:hypothetical protein